jgi:hypothetical protein
MITIDSFITFVRLGVEMICLFRGGETISETEMDDQWMMWPIAESFERKTTRILLQNHLSQPSRQLITKTMDKFENLELTWIEWCISSCYNNFFHCLNSWFVNGFAFVIILSHFIRIQFIIVRNWMWIEVILIIWTHSPLHDLEKNLVIEKVISCQNSYSITDKLSVRRYSSGWNQRWWNIYSICKPINFKVSFVLLNFAISSWGWSCSIIAHECDSNQGWMSKLRS